MHLGDGAIRAKRTIWKNADGGSDALFGMWTDLLPELSSFIGRICSGYAPPWGVLRTQLV
jgi:hypothetical protein